MDFYPADVDVPSLKRTDRLLLRPLRAGDAELDYDAVMSNPAALRRWSQSTWPADDFTLGENLADLERHEREHQERVAFTFTVLSPDGSRCLGCVYIKPVAAPVARLVAGARHATDVGFWVRASEVADDLDRHLLATLREWFESEWAFDRILFSISREETRQGALLSDAGLERLLEYELPDGRWCRAYGQSAAPGPRNATA